MFEVIIAMLGVAASALYVGYLAFAIAATPLWVIVIATFAVMILQFVTERRRARGKAPETRQ